MCSAYTLANHGKQSIIADKIKDIFLITFELRLDKGVFGCLMIGICVEFGNNRVSFMTLSIHLINVIEAIFFIIKHAQCVDKPAQFTKNNTKYCISIIKHMEHMAGIMVFFILLYNCFNERFPKLVVHLLTFL